MNSQRLRVLIISTHCDADDVGEVWNAYKWITGLSKLCDVTVLTQFREGRRPPSQQLSNARVIEWKEPSWFRRFERFNAMLKPWYVDFYRKCRKKIQQLQSEGKHFDVVHQLTPIAIRYPSPCVGFGIPYIIGPLSGGLPTPDGFKNESDSAAWYTRLRSLDKLRLRYDPMMRNTYSKASIVLGAAPYIKHLLSDINLRRFEVECEVGIDRIEPSSTQRSPHSGELRLLYVGRAVRTKGLRDAVRAIAHLADMPKVTLTAAGGGEELKHCQREAVSLGISDRVNFLGKVSRQDVEQLYQESDVFLFPSYREPTGGVILEAMTHGLPIVTANTGGPGHIVTNASGIRVEVSNPMQFARDLADAIRKLAEHPEKLRALSLGARERVEEIGLWDKKFQRVLALYQEIKIPR